MRPLLVEIEGFRSYRELTTIELPAGPVAIVGPNGGGKSSIIHAIAWCLYGQAPGRTQDDAVSTGASFCRVSLTFGIGGETYRARRERSLGRGANPHLGLYHLSPDGTETPAGGSTVASTQRAIEDLLGLTYEQWLATSYMAQREGGGFLDATPAERKELMVHILGLGRWQAWAERARKTAGELKGKVEALSLGIADLEAKLAGEDDARLALAGAQRDRQEAGDALAVAEGRLAEARKSLELAREEAASLDRTSDRLQHLRAARAEALIRAQRDAQRTADEQRKATGRVQALEQLVTRLRTAGECATALQADALVKRGEAEGHERHAEELGEQAAAKEVAAAESGVRAQQIQTRLPEIRQAIDVLTRARQACPTCGQDLSPRHRDELLARYQADHDRLRDQLGEAERRAREDGAAASGLRDRIAEAAARARALRSEAGELERAAERANAEAERIPEEEARLGEARTTVDALADDLEGLHKERERLSGPSDEERTLEEALATREDVRRRLAGATHAELEADAAVGRVRSRLEAAAATVGRAEEALANFERAREELREARAREAETARLRWGHDLLAEALGRSGIQAHLIEARVPETEADANDVLSRFTDGRLSVRLELQRVTKSAGIRETLEIAVADDRSERDLSTFSGGEADCVKIAFAMALGRLLARRAGRRPEALILDEPFTPLDPEHRQRGVEILHGLMGEFPALYLVTQEEELASTFPARLVVAQEDGSSTVRLEVAA